MTYQDIPYNELSKEMLDQLKKGAFMTTKVGDIINTMTIGWGGLNVVWYRDVFVAYVRYSRETHRLVEEADEFTISVPLEANMKQELAFCGTKSRRDVDKVKECQLQLQPGRHVHTPVIADCELHFECKVIYKQAMEPGNIPQDVKDKYYGNYNYHVVYYGEILDSYLIKGEK